MQICSRARLALYRSASEERGPPSDREEEVHDATSCFHNMMTAHLGAHDLPSAVVGNSRCVYCRRPTPSHLEAQLSCKALHRQSSGHERRCRSLTAHAAAPEQAETVASTSQPEAPQQQSTRKRTPGRQTYRPASFGELVNDATLAVKAAVADGLTRMEVEFPPLPGNVDGETGLLHRMHADPDGTASPPCSRFAPPCAGYKGSSDWFVDSNCCCCLHQVALPAAHGITPAEPCVACTDQEGLRQTCPHRCARRRRVQPLVQDVRRPFLPLALDGTSTAAWPPCLHVLREVRANDWLPPSIFKLQQCVAAAAAVCSMAFWLRACQPCSV